MTLQDLIKMKPTFIVKSIKSKKYNEKIENIRRN
jgi:hypothetical protein